MPPSTVSKKTKATVCKGGFAHGISGGSKCNKPCFIDDLCEEHYNEQKKDKEAIAKQKKEEQEQKDKEKLERNMKYEGQGNCLLVNGEWHIKDKEISDELATSIFIALMTDEKGRQLVQRDDDDLCIFDKTKGIWSMDLADIRKAIMKADLRLYYVSKDPETGEWVRSKKCTNYSGFVNNIEKVVRCLCFKLENTKFIERNIETNIGKLLFANGIYDFKTGEFIEEFDPSIVFFHRIERDFPSRNPEKIEWVKNYLFNHLFQTQEEADYLLQAVARAIYGDYHIRTGYMCRGDTASGKGMITNALKKTFPGLVKEFSADNLLFDKSSTDVAKQNMWLIRYKTSRLIISNEIRIEIDKRGKIKTSIDGNKVKRLISDGDGMDVRGQGENTYEVVNRTTLMMLGNDFPNFEPIDDAIKDRIKNVSFDFSFVENPDPKMPMQKKRDITVKKNFDDVEYQDALIWVIIDAYNNLVKGKSNPKAPIKKGIMADDEEEETFDSVFDELFDLGDDNDKIPVSEFNQHFTSRFGFSDKKIGIELNKLCTKRAIEIPSKVCNGKRYRYNIAKKRESIL